MCLVFPPKALYTCFAVPGISITTSKYDSEAKSLSLYSLFELISIMCTLSALNPDCIGVTPRVPTNTLWPFLSSFGIRKVPI